MAHRFLAIIIGLLILALMIAASLPIAYAQTDQPLYYPIYALRMDSSRVLLGQADVLIEGALQPTGFVETRRLVIGRGHIQAIAVLNHLTFVLSMQGVTVLDENWAITSYYQGSGQSLLIRNGRVLVAARQAGVRILALSLPQGQLRYLGTLKTTGDVWAIAPVGEQQLWVAEGIQGLRLYDLTNPQQTHQIVWINNLGDVRMVRAVGQRLYVIHDNLLSILDVSTPATPLILGSLSLDQPVQDMVLFATRAYVLQSEQLSLIALDNPQQPAYSMQYPIQGTVLGVRGGDVLVGSASGLTWLRVDSTAITQVNAWPATPVADVTNIQGLQPCVLQAPSNPQPAANSDVITTDELILRWTASCAASYEVLINGTLVATTQANQLNYRITPPPAWHTWQINAVGEDGQRLAGPVWQINPALDRLTTQLPSIQAAALPRLYTSNLLTFTPSSLQQAVLLICGTVAAGLGLIVGTAWYLGQRSQRYGK